MLEIFDSFGDVSVFLDDDCNIDDQIRVSWLLQPVKDRFDRLAVQLVQL